MNYFTNPNKFTNRKRYVFQLVQPCSDYRWFTVYYVRSSIQAISSGEGRRLRAATGWASAGIVSHWVGNRDIQKMDIFEFEPVPAKLPSYVQEEIMSQICAQNIEVSQMIFI